MLAAGFPCNSFTLLGLNLGEDDPKYGDLGKYVVKVARAKRPVVALLENVKTFFSTNQPWYKNLEKEFKKAGYVCSYNIVPAWALGLPQHRERGLLLAVRDDIQIPFDFPVPPNAKKVTLREFLLAPDSAELKSMKTIGVDKFDRKWARKPVPEPPWTDMLDKIPEGVRNTNGLRRLGMQKGVDRGDGAVYHDLGYHPCVVSSGRGWIFTRDVDNESLVIRKAHLHELRRIQGFPDDFKLHRLKMDSYRHIGNAIPPQMAEFIGRAVAEQYREAFLDEDDRNPGKTPRSWKSSRKSSRKSKHRSGHKSSRKAKYKSGHKSSRMSKHKSNHKSSNSWSRSNMHKSRHKSSRKRRRSTSPEDAPEPKRQPPAVRYQTRSQSKESAGFGGN